MVAFGGTRTETQLAVEVATVETIEYMSLSIAKAAPQQLSAQQGVSDGGRTSLEKALRRGNISKLNTSSCVTGGCGGGLLLNLV